MPISLLPKDTIKYLTSFSSITGSKSLIKELVDNALDAGATSISIETSYNSLDFIQVVDNGSGIEKDDRQVLAYRGYTSKITSLDDIYQLGGKHLGFRGLALSSIANISGELQVSTQTASDTVGEVLKFDRQGRLTR
jgi:DNA mismatch repair ATPase MutL